MISFCHLRSGTSSTHSYPLPVVAITLEPHLLQCCCYFIFQSVNLDIGFASQLIHSRHHSLQGAFQILGKPSLTWPLALLLPQVSICVVHMCVFRTLIDYYYLIYFDSTLGLFWLVPGYLMSVSHFLFFFRAYLIRFKFRPKRERKKNSKMKERKVVPLLYTPRRNHRLLTLQFLIRFLFKWFLPMTHTALSFSFLTIQFRYVHPNPLPPPSLPKVQPANFYLNPSIQIINASIAYIILNIFHVRQLIS